MPSDEKRRLRAASRASLVVGSFALVALFPLGVAPASADGCEAAVTEDGTIAIDDLPAGSSVTECDVVGEIVVSDEASLVIPEPGYTVSVENEYPDGSHDSFTVAVENDGEISYPAEDGRDSMPSEGGYSGSDGERVGGGECRQNGYNLLDAKMPLGGYRWKLGDGVRVAGLTTSETRVAITDFLNNITQGFNTCGRSDRIAVAQVYEGETTLESDMIVSDGDTSCGNWDSTSVIDFGNIDRPGSDPLATVCRRTNTAVGEPNRIIEADIRFNSTDYRWTNTGVPGCTNQFDLRAVGTHEAGHVFGLGHVNPTNYPDLTMAPATPSCDIHWRTLGLGDLLALEKRYPPQ